MRSNAQLGFALLILSVVPTLLLAQDRGIESDQARAAGEIEHREGRHELALPHLNRALRLDPNNADAWFWRGAASAALGKQRAAVNDFGRALLLRPLFHEARYHRAQAYRAFGLANSALEDCNRLLKTKVAFSHRVLELKAEIFITQMRDIEAKTLLAEVIELFPNSGHAYWLRSQISEALGNREAVIRDLDRARALGHQAPAPKRPVWNLARHHSEAQKTMNRIIERHIAFEPLPAVNETFFDLHARSLVDELGKDASRDLNWQGRRGGWARHNAMARALVYLGQEAYRAGDYGFAAQQGINIFLCSAPHMVRFEALRLFCRTARPERSRHWLDLIRKGRQDSRFSPALGELEELILQREKGPEIDPKVYLSDDC